ncbi:MAG: Na+/H+ antiporter NhaC family protein, partial [Bacteroidota bacterium]
SFRAAPGVRSRSLNAVLPIGVIIFGTLIGLLHTGFSSCADSLTEAGIAMANGSWGTIWTHLPQLPQAPDSFLQKLGSVIGASDSYAALLWSSISGLLVAILLSVGQRVLSLGEAIEATMNGFRTMLTAVLILVLAWSLAEVAEDLSTDHFLAEVLSSRLTPVWVPVLTFLLSAATAFATGSSWGTMALLYPLVLPTCWSICQEAGYDLADSQMIFYNVVSGVLAGSVLGDHCSPISDTTILSSLASSCNHIDHVRTQLPYALTVGSVALIVGTLPAAMGAPPLLLFVIGLVALYLIVHFFGKRVPAAHAPASDSTE